MPVVITEDLLTLPAFARAARVPLSTVQYWTKNNYDKFADRCIVRICGVAFVDPGQARGWLARPRYPRGSQDQEVSCAE
jgi:hypothetical protein